MSSAVQFSLPNLDLWYDNDPELKRECVKELMEWLDDQPHLPKLLEMHAICFLHSCWYDIERAKLTIDNCYTSVTRWAPLFDSVDEELVKKVLQVSFVGPLPKYTADGCLVMLIKFLDARSQVFDYVQQLKLFVMLLNLHLKQLGCPDGMIVIYDCMDFSLAHMMKMPLGVLRKVIDFVENAIPVRMKDIHFINMNAFVFKVLGLVRPFIRKELYDKFRLHAKMHELYRYVPAECLPHELGGHLSPLHDIQEQHKNNLLENMSYFRHHDTLKVDESKRRPRHQEGEAKYLGNMWRKFAWD